MITDATNTFFSGKETQAEIEKTWNVVIKSMRHGIQDRCAFVIVYERIRLWQESWFARDTRMPEKTQPLFLQHKSK